MTGEPLPLMSTAERQSYAAWLAKITAKNKSRVAEYLRRAAIEVRQHV